MPILQIKNTMTAIICKGADYYRKLELLKKVRTDVENWKIYYVDEINNEKWVEEYPGSELHAGGPPELRLMIKFPWE